MSLNKFLLVALVLGLLSSCTQRKYSQLTGFQWNKKTKTNNVVSARSGHFVSVNSDDVKTQESSNAVMVEDKMLSAIDSAVRSNPEGKKLVKNEPIVNTLTNKRRFSEQTTNYETKRTVNNVTKRLNPIHQAKKAKSTIANQTKDGGLLYIILVVILVLLILSLLEKILGPWLSGILILIILIVLILYLLGNL